MIFSSNKYFSYLDFIIIRIRKKKDRSLEEKKDK
jgi:hypothetical protein